LDEQDAPLLAAEPTPWIPQLLGRLRGLLRARDGNLTRELLREPGRFGLGQVPAGAMPDATTGMVCGYCSTGCSLNVHLRDGVAINPTPATDYPVNLGMACPKGWEALTVLDAPGPSQVRPDLALRTRSPLDRGGSDRPAIHRRPYRRVRGVRRVRR